MFKIAEIEFHPLMVSTSKAAEKDGGCVQPRGQTRPKINTSKLRRNGKLSSPTAEADDQNCNRQHHWYVILRVRLASPMHNPQLRDSGSGSYARIPLRREKTTAAAR